MLSRHSTLVAATCARLGTYVKWTGNPGRFSTSASRRTQTILHSRYEDIPERNLSIPEAIFPKLTKWGSREAVECLHSGRKYTYSQVLDGSLRFAGALRDLGGGSVPPAIAMFSSNSPEYPIYFLGASAAGTVVTLFSASSTKEELARLLEDSGASMIIVHQSVESLASDVIQKSKKDVRILVDGPSSRGNPNVREILLDKGRPLLDVKPVAPTNIAMMPYSSGTTGLPKAVATSHAATTNNMLLLADERTYMIVGKEDEVNAGILPFSHIYGIYIINLLGFYLGSKIVSMETFTPQNFIKLLKNHKVTTVHLVPPLLNFMTNSPDVKREDLSSLRGAICAAAPLHSSETEAFMRKIDREILFQEGYGMTECLVTHTTPVQDIRLGYCGVILPNIKAKVVDLASGKSVPPGAQGELWIKSNGNMSYYHNNPEATAVTKDKDDFIHTGDIVDYTEDGFFRVVDRIKELIKVKGLQVAPSELEGLLLQHPAVMDAGVVGISDPRSGELPRAYVVLRKDADLKEVRDFVDQKVSHYKRLEGGIRAVDSLPKNPTGKLLRRVLKEMAAEDS